jgi:anaerobic selenocysteine-containing dehydrogenase
VVIDPYRTRTAKVADWHIPIQPGTDTALALGLMRVIIEEGLYDRDYVAAHTHGFEALREHVQPYTPEHVAGLTGIAAADIERLAREYATSTPAVIRLNYGIQRSQNGGAAARAVCMLPRSSAPGSSSAEACSSPPAEPSRSTPRPWKARSDAGQPAAAPGSHRQHVAPGPRAHRARSPPVKALFVYNSNPAAIAPNQNAVVRGMMRSDLFTVVHEQFFTDTTDYADIVLPATTFLEHKDIQGAYGHYFLQLSEQAIAPLGEARSNVWLFSQLGQRMGFTEPCFHDSVDDLIDQALHRASDGRHHPPGTGDEKGEAPAVATCPHGGVFCRLPRAALPHPAARLSFIRARWKRRGSNRCRRFIRRTNRAGAPMRTHSRWSFCPARPTTI